MSDMPDASSDDTPTVTDGVVGADPALFDRIVAMWPPELDLSEPAAAPSGGWWFPKLARINADDLEARIDYTTDHWGSVGASAFYQAVTCHANDLYACGHRAMATSSSPSGAT